jgi:hypothetical protein
MTQTRFTKPLTLFLALAFIAAAFSGCQEAGDMLTAVLPPPPPRPRAQWHTFAGASNQDIPKIAVFVTDMSRRLYGTNEGIPREIEDRFIEQLLGKGYRVADRSDVAQVFNEIKFQHQGLTESDAARLGKMLNVPAVLVVTINSIDVSQPRYIGLNNSLMICDVRSNISARLIGVESAEVIGLTSFSDTYQENDLNNISSVLLVAEAVAEVIPARSN